MQMRSVQAGLGAGGARGTFWRHRAAPVIPSRNKWTRLRTRTKQNVADLCRELWGLAVKMGGGEAPSPKSQGGSTWHVPSLGLQASNSSSAITSRLAEVPVTGPLQSLPRSAGPRAPDVTKPGLSPSPFLPLLPRINPSPATSH